MIGEYGTSYVVAEDPTSAYNTVKAFLDAKDLGFESQRRLGCVELLADTNQYALPTMLHIQANLVSEVMARNDQT